MKTRDIPQSGRDGAVVHCHRAGAHYVRRHVEIKDQKTDARRRVREIMEVVSKGYSEWLTEPERDVWIAAAGKLFSRPRLGQRGPLAGQVLFVKLNGPRALIGRPWLRLPTEPVVFGPSPAGELTLRREQGRVRLELAVAGPVTEDIMVLATPPCRAAWKKCRKPRFLGLLPAPVNGVSDITALYLERFGEPEPGQRIFIRTVQQRDGWESAPVDTSNLVPANGLCATGAPNGGSRTSNAQHRTSNVEPEGCRGLELGIWCLSGAWCLEFGASVPSVPKGDTRCAHRRCTLGTPWPPGLSTRDSALRAALGRVSTGRKGAGRARGPSYGTTVEGARSTTLNFASPTDPVRPPVSGAGTKALPQAA